MVVGIITNAEKDPELSYTCQVRDFLTTQGVIVYEWDFSKLLTFSSYSAGLSPSLDSIHDTNFWVVLGGDGTILRCSHIAAVHDIPLLGINLGTLGFLTNAEKQDGFEVLRKVLKGEYEREKRMMLDIALPEQEALGSVTAIALNDVCIGTTGGLKVFSLYVNNHLLDTIRADGIIVATPTGSTAYSLSAGGPLLMPASKMMVITPICPHSLSIRPLVIGAEDTVRIIVHTPSPIYLDGQLVTEPGCDITIKKSVHCATIIKTAKSHFYDVLRKKKIL